jgi:hypothetical protein
MQVHNAGPALNASGCQACCEFGCELTLAHYCRYAPSWGSNCTVQPGNCEVEWRVQQGTGVVRTFVQDDGPTENPSPKWIFACNGQSVTIVVQPFLVKCQGTWFKFHHMNIEYGCQFLTGPTVVNGWSSRIFEIPMSSDAATCGCLGEPPIDCIINATAFYYEVTPTSILDCECFEDDDEVGVCLITASPGPIHGADPDDPDCVSAGAAKAAASGSKTLPMFGYTSPGLQGGDWRQCGAGASLDIDGSSGTCPQLPGNPPAYYDADWSGGYYLRWNHHLTTNQLHIESYLISCGTSGEGSCDPRGLIEMDCNYRSACGGSTGIITVDADIGPWPSTNIELCHMLHEYMRGKYASFPADGLTGAASIRIL